MLLTGWFRLLPNADVKSLHRSNWPWHWAAHHFYLALLLRSFDVGCECKIYLSVYGKYTNNCGIPPIQNTHINCAEVARWTVLVSCSTDLDYCVVIVDRVSVLLGHMHTTLKSFWMVYAKLPCCFSLFCLPFGSRSKHHNHCNIHLRSESITGNFEIRRHHKTFRQFLDICSCIKSESVCKYYSPMLHTNNVHKVCLYIKNWL